MDRPSPPFPRDADRQEQVDRDRARDSLFLSATLHINDESIGVRVRNLSAGGLMAEYARPVALGETLEIELRGIGRIAGRIAWATDGRIGIAFAQPIDPKLARKPVGQGGKKGEATWLHVYPGATPPRMKR